MVYPLPKMSMSHQRGNISKGKGVTFQKEKACLTTTIFEEQAVSFQLSM